MLKYINGEIYRLLHKRSMYIYFPAMAVGYVLLAYIRSGGFTESSIVNDAINLFNFLPILAGGFLFSAVYTDDLNSKNLISLVGFGLSKTKIVFSKLFLMTLFGTVVFGLTPVLHCGFYGFLGWPADAGTWATVYLIALKFLLTTIAFSALAGIVVYGLLRTTFSIVLYILLAFGVISGLLTTALNTFAPGLIVFLMPNISNGITVGLMGGGPVALPVFQYVVYVAAAAVLSVAAFYKKEMEF